MTNAVLNPSPPSHEPVTSEHAQLAALRQGNEAAFLALVSRYHNSMVRIAQMYVADRPTAEEVVQEAWLGVLRGLDRFEGRSSLKTWIFTIVSNLAKTRGKRERRSIPFSGIDNYDQDSDDPAVPAERFRPADAARYPFHWQTPPTAWHLDPSSFALNTELRAYLNSAVDALPEQQRVVITLRDIEGWSSDEICNVLHIAETNQRVLLHRARSKVRLALEVYLKGYGEMESGELTCKELVEIVTDYLEDKLSAPDRARLEAHLAECEGCDTYVAQMRQTIDSLGVLSEADVPPDAQSRLLTVFRSWRAG